MARLLLFEDRWSPGRFELPDKPVVTLGFSAECDQMIDVDPIERADRGLEATTIQLVREPAGWSLAQGQPLVTGLNGERVPERHLLRHEHVVTLHEFGFAFEDRDEVRNLELEQKISTRPGDWAPVRVWADWLQEQRDPLGERLALAARGGPVAPQAGCGLRDGHGFEVALGFRDGLLESVELRARGTRQCVRALLARLLSLRAARFLRTLRVDCCGMLAGEVLQKAELDQLIARLPPSLKLLDLGYSLEAKAPVILSGQQQAHLPLLHQSVVFFAARRAFLKEGEAMFEVSGCRSSCPKAASSRWCRTPSRSNTPRPGSSPSSEPTAAPSSSSWAATSPSRSSSTAARRGAAGCSGVTSW